jgi:hypothetical protein
MLSRRSSYEHETAFFLVAPEKNWAANRILHRKARSRGKVEDVFDIYYIYKYIYIVVGACIR